MRGLRALFALLALAWPTLLHAEPTSPLIARLAVDVCMAAVRVDDLDPATLPASAREVPEADKAALGLTAATRGWLFETDDDVVMLEVGEGCQVFAARTGSAAYLTDLEALIRLRYGAFAQVADASRPDDPNLRMRIYRVTMPPPPAGAPRRRVTGETVVATYPAPGATKLGFTVAVIAIGMPPQPAP